MVGGAEAVKPVGQVVLESALSLPSGGYRLVRARLTVEPTDTGGAAWLSDRR